MRQSLFKFESSASPRNLTQMNQTVVCVILFLVRNVSTPAWGRAWVGLTAFRVNISENLGKTAVLTMITSLMYISTS